MFPSNTLNPAVRDTLNMSTIFDFYRVVDNRTHEVMEYPEGASDPVPTGTTCHHIWGDKGPCPNCTSRSCVAHKKPIVKIMHLDGTVYLIYSTPVVINKQDYALELIKDVTDSFMVPSAMEQDNVEITYIIERFNDLAVHDSFTGLYNKNYILNQVQEVLDEHRKAGTPPKGSCMMLDLDLFKEINDHYGHNAGDDILLYFSVLLNQTAQEFEGGWAARYGGDEFVLFVPEGIDEEGIQIVTHMMDLFAKHKFVTMQGSPVVTVSYGVADLRADDTARSVIDRADDAMYAMKESHHAQMGVNR